MARYDACYTFTTFSGEIDIAVMRYYEHGSLDGFMRRGDLSLEERYDILTQILEGIAYLHSHGIIHRDLKPQNVLMVHHAGRYIPKITDFGISKQLEDGESSLVSNSVLGGTRSYASPEQLCERVLRKNTDLWSFGVIAYNMLLGELPFTTGTFSSSSDEGRSEQLRQVLSGRLPEGINHISEPWQSVIRGCLVVDGTQRLQHAEDCLDILHNGRIPKPTSESQEDTTVADAEVEITILDNEVPNVKVAEQIDRRYCIGDYYIDKHKRGVVFEISDDCLHGKIVSLDEVSHTRRDVSLWCKKKGNGWYLPNRDELKSIYKHKDVINATIEKNRGTLISNSKYWSSNNESILAAYYVKMSDGTDSYIGKFFFIKARSVASF